MPYLMMYDREMSAKSVSKAYKSHGHITCMHYGPYDNGHILVGLSTGDFFAFDSITLNKLCNVKIASAPITSITCEPTCLLLISIQ